MRAREHRRTSMHLPEVGVTPTDRHTSACWDDCEAAAALEPWDNNTPPTHCVGVSSGPRVLVRLMLVLVAMLLAMLMLLMLLQLGRLLLLLLPVVGLLLLLRALLFRLQPCFRPAAWDGLLHGWVCWLLHGCVCWPLHGCVCWLQPFCPCSCASARWRCCHLDWGGAVSDRASASGCSCSCCWGCAGHGHVRAGVRVSQQRLHMLATESACRQGACQWGLQYAGRARGRCSRPHSSGWGAPGWLQEFRVCAGVNRTHLGVTHQPLDQLAGGLPVAVVQLACLAQLLQDTAVRLC